MIDLLRWAIHKRQPSRVAARQRLHLILFLDRVGLAQDKMESLKRDILDAVSKYLVVDEDTMEVEMERSEGSLVLTSNIQVKDFVRTFATP